MGSLKRGDLIIVTEVIHLPLESTYATKAKSLINSIHIISQVDYGDYAFPYRVEVGDDSFWAKGIPYSALMMELL